MSESANSLELISNLNKVIEKRGLNKTIEILKKGQQPEKVLQEEIISIIKVLVCDNFDITERNMLFGSSRKHKMISRTNACVSKYIKDILTLSESIVYERELIQKKILIEKLLKEKINHILRYGEEK